MTSRVIHLADQKHIRQTTLRADAELLRKARFYLDEEGKSVAQFLVEQLERYVQQREESGSPPMPLAEGA